MNLALGVLLLVVISALVFDYINGFHDTANAIATVVGTRVLPLWTAIMLAALLNFVGALTGTAVASTIGKEIITPEAVSQVMVLSALLGAICWGLITWYYGIPSSSSHALIGALLGAALAKAGVSVVHFGGLEKICITLVTSPLAGFLIGLLTMLVIVWVFRRGSVATLSWVFRKLQLVSACAMAFSHGSNDAQKSMGVITVSLLAFGYLPHTSGALHIPTWVVLACAAAMALGTASGGLRIIKTMGTKIIDLEPVHGFAAETSAAVTILTCSHMGLPVSTTHVISAAIMGVGACQNAAGVRWGITHKILTAWVLTIPISALMGALVYKALSLVLGA